MVFKVCPSVCLQTLTLPVTFCLFKVQFIFGMHIPSAKCFQTTSALTCLVTLTLPVTFGQFKVQCSYLMCIFHWPSTFRRHQLWPALWPWPCLCESGWLCHGYSVSKKQKNCFFNLFSLMPSDTSRLLNILLWSPSNLDPVTPYDPIMGVLYHKRILLRTPLKMLQKTIK